MEKQQKKYEESKVQEIMKKMKSLDMMKDEIKQQSEIKVKVLERLIQIRGDLYEFNPIEQKDQLRVKDIFMCIDKVGEY